MKLLKRFMVQNPKVLDDSYVTAAVDEEHAGFSIHDGKATIAFRFNLGDELDAIAFGQVLESLNLAIRFLRQETGRKTVRQRAVGLLTRGLSAVLPQRKTPSDCPPRGR